MTESQQQVQNDDPGLSELDQGTFTLRQGNDDVGWAWRSHDRNTQQAREIWLVTGEYTFPNTTSVVTTRFTHVAHHLSEYEFYKYVAAQVAGGEDAPEKQYEHSVVLTNL